MSCLLEAPPGYPNLELKNNEVLVLGRRKLTKIKDTGVSRNQVEVSANTITRRLTIKQIGPNDSTLNGNTIGIGLTVTAKDGDTLELVEGQFPYKISFTKQTQIGGQKTGNTNQDSGLPPVPPKKIPKMFLPKGADPEDFRNDANSMRCETWEHIKGNDLLIYSYHPQSSEPALQPSTQIAAFDMDGTIITTKSGKVFPTDDQDWRFLTNTTVQKLQSFFKEHPSFKFVIFSNQAGLEKHAAKIPSFKKKIEAIAKAMGLSVVFLMGTAKNEFRKPMTGSWDIFVKKYNDGVEPDKLESFYCGDAAGRKKDHSIGDRLFALNLGIPFQTPEEFFQGFKPQEYTMPLFNPGRIVESDGLSNCHIDFPHPLEVIILVGFPASGKSSFVKYVLMPKGYLSVNRDTMKTMSKCVTAAHNALADGTSVVIDNTNGTKKAREDFLKVALKHKAIVRCFKMMVDFNHAQHNNRYRQLLGLDPHDKVPMVAFNTFKAQFQEPSLDEGFTEIVPVNFVPVFENDEHKKLYSLYLLEK